MVCGIVEVSRDEGDISQDDVTCCGQTSQGGGCGVDGKPRAPGAYVGKGGRRGWFGDKDGG